MVVLVLLCLSYKLLVFELALFVELGSAVAEVEVGFIFVLALEEREDGLLEESLVLMSFLSDIIECRGAGYAALIAVEIWECVCEYD